MIGIGIMLYPFFVSSLNNLLDQRRLDRYEQRDDEERRRLEAKKNDELAEYGLNAGAVSFDVDNATDLELKQYEKHLVGSIAIPNINVRLPLFDTTNEILLENGATLVPGTSFPLGGADTHAVISAHSGLPDRKLFTDLEKLKKGDQFVLDVLNEKLAYEVFQKQVVSPQDTSVLEIIPGEDLVTLLTCTPYMVNSHRLLVTGKRVPYNKTVAQTLKNTSKKQKQLDILKILVSTIIMLLILYGIFRVWRTFLLRKKKFDLIFYRFSQNGEPLAKETYALMIGKDPATRNGIPLTATSDTAGKVAFTDLPGGMYVVTDQKHKFHIGVKQLKQSTMKIYPDAHSKNLVIKTNPITFFYD